ncbi:toll/interleukin-1 receptor domain-containing protein [Bradyrhizobium sp. LTSP849]|uniref:toll/interleukin-1 receptor domain-containing protein n=1 Tax=Bradyrhizobium sp. LTSP849 TaxID=1615890 RepID=UPI0009E273A1|nr:toll/interleukin-1 receptor domain-containing protein [Bradyrhizobium sp. LTSP849]
MRVFISWSGELSRQLGEAIRGWLPSTLQHVKPYFTPNDIDKGAKWASEIFKELSASAVCVIVLTRENLSSSWIMFEAGAISSTIENSRVCPIIFNIEPTDLQGPLAQFQVTRFVKADIRKLFNTINLLAAENKLDDAVADTVFEKWWPDLESSIRNILEGHTAKKDTKKIRSDRELIEEILLLIRASEKDKAPPSTPPHPYERTITATIMTALKEIVEEDDGGFITRDFLHTKLREIEAHAHKLGESRSRTIILDELSSLVERTKPRPQPTKDKKRVAPLKKPADDDDDIPF